MTTAYLNRIATAVPEHDVHKDFSLFAEQMLDDPRLRAVFRRMVSRADIAHRYSFLDPQIDPGRFSSHDARRFYRLGNFPNTAQRMELFEETAPLLMRKAVDELALTEKERSGITHILVTCCTGLYAPGVGLRARRSPSAFTGRRAHDGWIYGLLCGNQRPEAGAAHCPFRSTGRCAHAEP